jgi:hypothetical protein
MEANRPLMPLLPELGEGWKVDFAINMSRLTALVRAFAPGSQQS